MISLADNIASVRVMEKSGFQANSITLIRILCSIAILFCPVFSVAFYALYIAAGLSDMMDGWVARRTHTASAFGAKLDTVADVIFVIVCLIKLLPVMDIPETMLMTLMTAIMPIQT